MIQWQQTLFPSVLFYALAGVVALCVATMISGLATVLHRLEVRGKKEHAK